MPSEFRNRVESQKAIYFFPERVRDGHVSPEDRADFTKTQEVHLAEADDGTWSAVDLLLLFS